MYEQYYKCQPRAASSNRREGLNDPARRFNSSLASTVKFDPWLASLTAVNNKAWAAALRICGAPLKNSPVSWLNRVTPCWLSGPLAYENKRRRTPPIPFYNGVQYICIAANSHDTLTALHIWRPVSSTIRSASGSRCTNYNAELSFYTGSSG